MRQFLKDIVVEAGRMALAYRGRLGQMRVDKKSVKDLVTDADRIIEKFLRKEIGKRYPEHGILGEEEGEKAGKEYRWLIDPIDGTTSFVHGQPFFGVSIGLEKSGEPVLGAVSLPAMGELYEAQKGGGAYCNGKAIGVSQCSSLAESVMATSVGCIGQEAEIDNMNYLGAVKGHIISMRNFGSAAMHLCYVACGRLEGYWQVDIKPYDVAAGILLVTEAGGKYSDFSGGMSKFYKQVLTTNGRIHEDMIKILGSCT